jgi:hypothetical protein
MKSIFAIGCILGFPQMLLAQVPDSRPELPPGTLIETRAPDYAEWEITQQAASISDSSSDSNTPPAGHAAAAAESSRDTITKTHNVIRIVRLDTAKRPWIIWCHGGQEYMIWPDGKSCAQTTPGPKNLAPNPFYIDFSNSDFSGFEWISKQNYLGIKSYQGTKCIVFQAVAGRENDSDGGGASTTSKEIAYIDLKSRLPIALQSGGEEYLYAWHAPPQAMLSFPSMVQALIDAGVKAQRQMAQKAVQPW